MEYTCNTQVFFLIPKDFSKSSNQKFLILYQTLVTKSRSNKCHDSKIQNNKNQNHYDYYIQ